MRARVPCRGVARRWVGGVPVVCRRRRRRPHLLLQDGASALRAPDRLAGLIARLRQGRQDALGRLRVRGLRVALRAVHQVEVRRVGRVDELVLDLWFGQWRVSGGGSSGTLEHGFVMVGASMLSRWGAHHFVAVPSRPPREFGGWVLCSGRNSGSP